MYQIQTIATAAAVVRTQPSDLKPSKVNEALRVALRLPDPELARACELLATESLIPVEHRLAEELLVDLRYENYQHLSPMQATELFAWTFLNHVSERDVEDLLDPKLFAERKADIRHFWEARQRADLLGMQYETYIEIAISVHFASGKKEAPQPKDLLAPAVIAAASHHARFEQSAEEDDSEEG